MAIDPLTDGSGWSSVPDLTAGMRFQDYGSYGLRQYGGWVREEYLSDLVGRNGARAYREMLDSSPVIGGMIFAITQAMRRVDWRVEPAGTDGLSTGSKQARKAANSAAEREAEFVESLMEDMSHTWEDFVIDALSMLGYGYAPMEIVYKRRLGRRPESMPGPRPKQERASSKFDDGRIGWRRLPIRGQDTVIKWFFDPNGQIRGMTQQPWVGVLIDIPIEKMLLFRPNQHKNNPEGRSVLRNAYRSWYFTKRLEEQEAIKIERLNGFPVMYVPNELFDKAGGTGPEAVKAAQALQQYKNIVSNVRIDEQMGAVFPSNVYANADGKLSSQRMFELKFETPAHTGDTKLNETISRHKVDMMLTLLCDFIMLGHEVRGTNNLAVTKVDMFYAAVEGWLNGMASVVNRYGLSRIWSLNGLDPDLMPEIKPDLSQRLDLDSLGNYLANMQAAGVPVGDTDTQIFLREAGGMPASEEVVKEAMGVMQQALAQQAALKTPVTTNGKKPAKAKAKQKADANAD